MFNIFLLRVHLIVMRSWSKEALLQHLALLGSVFSSSLSISLAPVPLPPAICQRGREDPISLAMPVRSLKARRSLLVPLGKFRPIPYVWFAGLRNCHGGWVRQSTSGGERRQAVPCFLRTWIGSEKLGHTAKSLYCWDGSLMFSETSRQGHRWKDIV